MSHPPRKLRRRSLLGALAGLVAMPGCVRGDNGMSDDGDLATEAPPGAPQRPGLGPGAHGRVFDRTGRPLAQVFVQAAGFGPGDPPVLEMAVFSDARGYWHWSLRPGRYVLTFSVTGRSTRREVRVGAGETVTLDVVLD